MALFIILKNKNTKKWKGIIPAKKGVSRTDLRKFALRGLKKGLSFSIINTMQLKKILLKNKLRLKRKTKRPIRRRVTKKSKRRRK